MTIAELAEKIREQEGIHETPETINLVLSKEVFVTRMLQLGDGQSLLDLLEDGEWRVAERLKLIKGERIDGQVKFTIPRWNHLITHLRMVNNVTVNEEWDNEKEV